jgi:hypothetical protein
VFALVGFIISTPMSLADIRARREVKHAESHVRSSSSSESKPIGVEPLEPLFGELPSSTEIQSSPERGRGVYAKEPLRRGE